MGDRRKHLSCFIPLIIVCVTFARQLANIEQSMTIIIRYIFSILIIRGSHRVCEIWYDIMYTKRRINIPKILKHNALSMFTCAVCLYTLVYFNFKHTLLAEDFPYLFIAYSLIMQIDLFQERPVISFGLASACSYIEGYLAEVLPSDGGTLVGFEKNIDTFESNEGVVFPVRKLFILINKSFFCPPNLEQWNKPHREDLPWIESVKSLAPMEKDVAGVKNRKYSNSVYKILRPKKLPVYLCVECATPIYTMSKVLKRSEYDKLCDVDAEEEMDAFVEQLRKGAEWPIYKDKYELVFFDAADNDVNLANILLEKIRELEPNFEEIVRKKNEEMKEEHTEIKAMSQSLNTRSSLNL